MSSADKKLDRMRNNPAGWHISDVLALADRYGIEARTTGGSHYVLSHAACPENLSIPAHRPIKPVYIKLFVMMVNTVREAHK